MVQLLAAFVLGLLVWAVFPQVVRLAIWCVKAILVVGMLGALVALTVVLKTSNSRTTAPTATVTRSVR